MNDKFGLFCVTPVCDNMLMWAHYSNSHKGFCVGFDSERLFENVLGRGGYINYTENYPEISPLLEDAFEIFIHKTNTKAKFWSYEVEYRIFKNINDGRIKVLSADTITEIILGCNMTNEHKSEILQTVGEYYPNTKVYQMKPKNHSFDLEKSLIIVR